MLFAHEQDALAWYESEERVLTPNFIANIPWDRVRSHVFPAELVPVVTYMRDVESFTEIYYRELLATPTGHNPYVRRFMERWSSEEPTHADLLHRFLVEAGAPVYDDWKRRSRVAIPKLVGISSRATTFLAKLFGSHFASVHMVWGAVNEQSTLIGYRRLWEAAAHPVLEHILRGIVREEARHALFYWSVARIQLLRSRFRQRLSRCMIEWFWGPVGQGLKTRRAANEVIAALFSGAEGLRATDRLVNDRIAQLPGFAGLTRITDRIARVAMR